MRRLFSTLQSPSSFQALYIYVFSARTKLFLEQTKKVLYLVIFSIIMKTRRRHLHLIEKEIGQRGDSSEHFRRSARPESERIASSEYH